MNILRLPSAPITATFENKLIGIAFVCLACFLWTALELTGLFIPKGHNAFQTVWVRYGFHIIFMLIVFGPSYKTNLVRTRLLKLQLFRPLLMIGMPLFFILGVRFMPQKNMWTIFWSAPIMILVLSAIFLQERAPLPNWLAALAGWIGVFAIYQPTIRLLVNWTMIFPLAMAFCFSFYLVLTRAMHTESTQTSLFYTAFIVFLPWSIGLPSFWQTLNIKALAIMSVIGFLGYWSLYFFDKAHERAPASSLAPFLFTQPVFSVFLSYFLFHQSPGLIRLVGSAGLIGITALLVVLERFRAGRDRKAFALAESIKNRTLSR